ncbi:transposon Ty3-I Gag-Pol polyprotein [Trichonephila clavipes]|nr:transposon Ty3-I Gag-Pol polyprotein [Trichonephila clavipes]
MESITDRGAVFRSRLVSSLVDLCNIDHRFTTAYHPQTNGLTERFWPTCCQCMWMYWDEILPFVTFAYNTAHSSQSLRITTASPSAHLRAQDKDRRRYDSKHQMVLRSRRSRMGLYSTVALGTIQVTVRFGSVPPQFREWTPWGSKGPLNSLPLPPTSGEDLRLYGYLEYRHAAKALFIDKHPCLLQDSNPGPTDLQSASLTIIPDGW